jgi:hypothetical protein
MEDLSREMAEGKATSCSDIVKSNRVIHKNRRSDKKKKRSKKRKTCGNMENSPSFPHSHTVNKQQVNY